MIAGTLMPPSAVVPLNRWNGAALTLGPTQAVVDL
jgi:hypothetical protein